MHKDTSMCGPRGLEFGTNYLCATRVSTSLVKVWGRIEKWKAEERNRHALRPVMDLYKWEVNGSCLWSTLGSEWTLALASNSWWYLTVTLMTFSSDRQGPRVTPIRRTTPLQSARRAVKEPQPQPLPANLGMNYWKGQSWAPPWREMELAEWSNWHSFRTRGKGTSNTTSISHMSHLLHFYNFKPSL